MVAGIITDAQKRVELVGTDVIIHCETDKNAERCYAGICKTFQNPAIAKALLRK